MIRTKKGAAGTEYAILAGLIGIVTIATVVELGRSTSDQLETANTQLDQTITTAAATAAAGGNGNGNNGNGNGNGASNPSTACFVDTSGNDTITSTQVPETTTCVNFENGGVDVLNLLDRFDPLTINSIAASGDYETRTFNMSSNDNTMVLINGRHVLNVGGGNNTIDASNHNLEDFGFLSFSNGEQIRFEKFDRSFSLVIDNFLGGTNTSINSIQFANRTLSAADILNLTLESQQNNSTQLRATINDDTIELRCHTPPTGFSNFRSVYGNGGDDTFNYIAGRQRIDASNAPGFDTMNVPFNSTQVSFETSGSVTTSIIMRFPTGDFVNFNSLADQHNAGNPTTIDQVVFNDTTLTVTDMIARASTDTPLSAFASNCPAQGEQTGQQLLWSNGPYDGNHPSYTPPPSPFGNDFDG